MSSSSPRRFFKMKFAIFCISIFARIEIATATETTPQFANSFIGFVSIASEPLIAPNPVVDDVDDDDDDCSGSGSGSCNSASDDSKSSSSSDTDAEDDDNQSLNESIEIRNDSRRSAGPKIWITAAGKNMKNIRQYFNDRNNKTNNSVARNNNNISSSAIDVAVARSALLVTICIGSPILIDSLILFRRIIMANGSFGGGGIHGHSGTTIKSFFASNRLLILFGSFALLIAAIIFIATIVAFYYYASRNGDSSIIKSNNNNQNNRQNFDAKVGKFSQKNGKRYFGKQLKPTMMKAKMLKAEYQFRHQQPQQKQKDKLYYAMNDGKKKWQEKNKSPQSFTASPIIITSSTIAGNDNSTKDAIAGGIRNWFMTLAGSPKSETYSWSLPGPSTIKPRSPATTTATGQNSNYSRDIENKSSIVGSSSSGGGSSSSSAIGNKMMKKANFNIAAKQKNKKTKIGEMIIGASNDNMDSINVIRAKRQKIKSPAPPALSQQLSAEEAARSSSSSSSPIGISSSSSFPAFGSSSATSLIADSSLAKMVSSATIGEAGCGPASSVAMISSSDATNSNVISTNRNNSNRNNSTLGSGKGGSSMISDILN